jgi:hypothetical protein
VTLYSMAVPVAGFLWVVIVGIVGCRDFHVHVHIGRGGNPTTEVSEVTTGDRDGNPQTEEIIIHDGNLE